MHEIKHIYTVPTTHSSKFVVDNRYNVYISPFCKCMNRVIDTQTNTDITTTLKGDELMILAFSHKEDNDGNQRI